MTTPSGSYFFSQVAAHQPYIYVATTAGGTGSTITVPLDDVFVTDPSGNLPAATPFTLTNGTNPFKYQIAVDTSIWSFDASPIRPTVKSGFDSFLQSLDAAGLKGGRLHQIRGWLAQALPQTFAESLYFRYGLDPAERCVELTPGMRLRVDFQAHQAVDPGNSQLNGFVGLGTSYIEIGTAADAQGNLVLGFDRFLSGLQGLTVGASPGAAGAVDLQSPAFQLPYWRLHYPQSFVASSGTGFAGTQQNAVLIGGPTRAALEAATTQYLKDGTVPTPAIGVWFRGRVAPAPEIPVLLQGEWRWWSLGTTLRGLLSGFTPVPWVTGKLTPPSNLCSRMLTFLRGSQTVDWQLQSPYAVVHFDSTFYNYGATLDPFDMPLVGGDSIALPVS
jgi:hypothetical protein